MLKMLIISAVALMFIYQIITAIDYWYGIPIVFYKVEAYVAYLISVLFLGLAIVNRGEIVNIIFIAFIIYWLIQSIRDYIDYKYEAQESQVQEDGENQKQEGE